MKFKPKTRRFRVPGDTSNNSDSEIVLEQDDDGDLGCGIANNRFFLLLSIPRERVVIAALGFPTEPTADDEPEIETLVEVPA